MTTTAPLRQKRETKSETAERRTAARGQTSKTLLPGLVAVIAWSAVGTFAILMICKFTTGLRVPKEEEIEGLDYTQHGETIHP